MPQPRSIAPPEIDCVSNYTPNPGNNGKSRSQVYGMLLKKHKSGSLSERFALADEDVITMGQMNYHLFGRLPSTDNRSQIRTMLKQERESNINYYFMKGFLRTMGILGVPTFSDVENSLLGIGCEERIHKITSVSRSPIRVFTESSADSTSSLQASSGQGVRMRIRVENRVVNKTLVRSSRSGLASDIVSPEKLSSESSLNTEFNFTALPSGKLKMENGKLIDEIAFDYELFGDYRPQGGILVKGKLEKSGELGTLIEKLNLGFLEREIVNLMENKVPEANYYFLSVFPKEEADKALRWEINPKPDREYKYIFYIKPYVENPIHDSRFTIQEGIPQNVIEELQFKREGLTVFDYNVFVDY
jgi:hypothetical protein